MADNVMADLFKDIPEDKQRQAYEFLHGKFGGRRKGSITKEKLLSVAADIHKVLTRHKLNIPQQKAALNFVHENIDRANGRWKNPDRWIK